jgi:dihydroorotate dehydrogenase
MMLDPFRILRPILHAMDSERAHRLALFGLRSRLATVFYRSPVEDPVLQQRVWNRSFPNPIGLAAGFDKNAVAFEAALDLGFGFVEVGGVTPLPQKGNPRPRLFRLEKDRAVINRMGFNNDGLAVVESRLKRRSGRGIVGVNLGKNKDQTDPTADYATLAGALARYADFLVINVSSPNTPGLRALQSAEPLIAIIRAARGVMPREGAPPLLIKLAPDLTAEDLAEAVRAARAEKLDGIVISNTTLARPASLQAPERGETGGLSGAPLFELSTRVLADVYKLTDGAIPLIGVGGVASGADAYAKIRAGASLVQLYSALVFEGPGLVNTIKEELAALLKRDGFTSVAAAVGADHR